MQTKEDITPYNDKGERHGYWEVYHLNGQLWAKGTYFNGIRHGYWEQYISDGRLYLKGNYVNGIQKGFWYMNKLLYFFT